MEQNKEDMKMLRPTATSVRAEEGYITSMYSGLMLDKYL